MTVVSEILSRASVTIEEASIKPFREFTKNDWYAYSDAEKFASKESPIIYVYEPDRDTSWTLIVHASGAELFDNNDDSMFSISKDFKSQSDGYDYVKSFPRDMISAKSIEAFAKSKKFASV